MLAEGIQNRHCKNDKLISKRINERVVSIFNTHTNSIGQASFVL